MQKNEILDLPSEVWRPIESTQGVYLVSNLGRVKSVARSIITKRELKPCKSTLLKPSIRGQYLTVYLSVDGGIMASSIHRLVAKAFIPNPDEKRFVNHKDLDKLNNRLDNLEWCTHAENMSHARLNGAMDNGKGGGVTGPRPTILGEKNPNCKLTDGDVKEVVRLFNNRFLDGISTSEIAKRYGIDPQTVRRYAKGVYRKGLIHN